MSKRIHLVGGLGNQLFQMALAIEFSRKEMVELEIAAGKPRRSINCEADVFAFEFNFPYTISKIQYFLKLRQVTYLLLLKIASKKFDNAFCNRSLIRMKGFADSFLGIFLSDGVGYDKRILKAKGRNIVAPAHTFIFSQSIPVLHVLRNAKLVDKPAWLLDLMHQADRMKPIVLHIRLADYLNISQLGYLSSDYYNHCLRILVNDFPDSPIWLFSDDPLKALEMVDEKMKNKVRIIDADLSNSAANLEAMRLGAAYVLSNSTYSWWGAFLSYLENPVVYCPDAWFRDKKNPERLIPIEWIRVKVI